MANLHVARLIVYTRESPICFNQRQADYSTAGVTGTDFKAAPVHPSRWFSPLRISSPGRSVEAVESYLRFTVSGVTSSIQHAALRLYATTNGTTNGPAIYAGDPNWTETGITWNTRPALTSGALDNKGAIATLVLTLAGSGTATPTNTPTATVTPTATPVGGTLLKTITFENGSLTHATSGSDSIIGTVSVETSTPLRGSWASLLIFSAAQISN